MWAQGLLETSGTTSTVNELIELAGAKNVCRQPKEHIVINKETLLEYNPDLILLWNNDAMSPENIMSLPELQNVNAIKNHQVYELPEVFWCDLWTLKFQYAVKLLAKYCYPVLNENLNLESEKIQMITTLYGKTGQNLLQ
jgi:iron complex transport system substrate-binding protein